LLGLGGLATLSFGPQTSSGFVKDFRQVRRLVASACILFGLAACGGGLEPMPRRADAVPAPAVLTSEVRLSDPAAARARLEATLARNPDELGALNDLAVTYLAEGRSDAARQLLDEVVARGGAREQQAALLNLAAIYAQDGYQTAAIAHGETAREIDPSRAEPHYALALLASARGDRALALARVREALRLDEGGAARAALAPLQPEARLHLEALLAESRGDDGPAAARWRELRAGSFPALTAVADRWLDPR
jgi:tetratricopeptide (TPR) repeat protein